MNRLNRKVEYALMALKIMAQKRAGQLTSTKEVVDLIGCPFDATAHILQLLVQKDILRSEQGAKGGYVLVRDLTHLSVLDLMEMILGPIAIVRCLDEHSDCDLKGQCNIVSPVANLNRKLIEFYRSVSVGELLRVREAGASGGAFAGTSTSVSVGTTRAGGGRPT
jgi:Rrf2 family nitric oxide-sensitive transcriptional repressor